MYITIVKKTIFMTKRISCVLSIAMGPTIIHIIYGPIKIAFSFDGQCIRKMKLLIVFFKYFEFINNYVASQNSSKYSYEYKYKNKFKNKYKNQYKCIHSVHLIAHHFFLNIHYIACECGRQKRVL